MFTTKREIVFLTLLLFLVGIYCDNSMLTLPDIFYPAGTSVGDIIAPTNDDGSTGRINLNIQFPFFGDYHTQLFVSITQY